MQITEDLYPLTEPPYRQFFFLLLSQHLYLALFCIRILALVL